MKWMVGAALLVVLVASVYLVGFSEKAMASVAHAEKGSNVPFLVVAKGAGANNGMYGDKTLQIIDSDEELNNALYRYGVKAAQPVNFNTHNVALLDMGLHLSGGYSISVSSIEQGDGFVRINANSRAPGRDCVTSQVLTSPFVLVTIPKKDDVVFSESIEKMACS